jgi:hypothetical protein
MAGKGTVGAGNFSSSVGLGNRTGAWSNTEQSRINPQAFFRPMRSGKATDFADAARSTTDRPMSKGPMAKPANPMAPSAAQTYRQVIQEMILSSEITPTRRA